MHVFTTSLLSCKQAFKSRACNDDECSALQRSYFWLNIRHKKLRGHTTILSRVHTLSRNIKTVASSIAVANTFPRACCSRCSHLSDAGAQRFLACNAGILRSRERRIYDDVTITHARAGVVLKPVLPLAHSMTIAIIGTCGDKGTVSPRSRVAHTASGSRAHTFACAHFR